MGKVYAIEAILAMCAVTLFFVQRKHHSEVLVILSEICAGAALALLLIALCVNAIFVRPLYD